MSPSPLHLKGLRRKDAEKRARHLRAIVNLDHRFDHRPEELSGGEKQRVAIARALAFDPPVLLADEPTGNLDTHSGAEILRLLRDLREQTNSTVLIVTHDAGIAESCPRTVCLRDARITGDLRR